MGKSLLGKYEPALEAIAFQPTHFGKLLENIFQEIRDSGVRSADALDNIGFGKALEAAIRDHTNFNTKVVFLEDSFKMFVETKIRSMRHPFVSKEIKQAKASEGSAERVLQELARYKEVNSIDLKTGKVYGAFKDIAEKTGIGVALILHPDITAAHCAAALLHEIGHAEGVCEFYDKFHTTNQVLAAVSRSVEVDPPEKKKVVFTTASKILGGTPKLLDGLENVADQTTVATVVIDASFKSVSLVDSDHYDETSFEQVADQYVARCGYGRPLLELISLSENKHHPKPITTGGVKLAVFAAMLVALIGSTPLALSTLAVAPAAAYCYAAITEGGTSRYNLTYDTVKVRMKRVREQIIEYVKDKNLSSEEVKKTLSDLEKTEMLINTVSEPKEALFDRISNYLMKKNRTLKEVMELQRDLEELAHNELYVAAAKLRNF